MPQSLGAGVPAGGHFEHEIEYLLAHLFNGAFPVGDVARVDVPLLVAILTTGTLGKPIALPHPIVNAIRLHPPAAKEPRWVQGRTSEGGALCL